MLQSARVLDRLRERVRYIHYSLNTEQVYVYWARFFIRWSGHGGAIRNPCEMRAGEVELFPTHFPTDRMVSTSTDNQKPSVVLLPYRKVLSIELHWLNGANRPAQKRRIPDVLTKDKVAGLRAQKDEVTVLTARLHYGTHTDIRTVQELLSHSDVSSNMIYTQVLKVAAGGTASPLDGPAHKH